MCVSVATEAPAAMTHTKKTMIGCLNSSLSVDSTTKVKTGASAARHCCCGGSRIEIATFVSARSATETRPMTPKMAQLGLGMGWKHVGWTMNRIISHRMVHALETAL